MTAVGSIRAPPAELCGGGVAVGVGAGAALRWGTGGRRSGASGARAGITAAGAGA